MALGAWGFGISKSQGSEKMQTTGRSANIQYQLLEIWVKYASRSRNGVTLNLDVLGPGR